MPSTGPGSEDTRSTSTSTSTSSSRTRLKWSESSLRLEVQWNTDHVQWCAYKYRDPGHRDGTDSEIMMYPGHVTPRVAVVLVQVVVPPVTGSRRVNRDRDHYESIGIISLAVPGYAQWHDAVGRRSTVVLVRRTVP
eukprot:96052-Rhodomonas_salina.2